MVHVLDAGIAEVALLRDRAAVARLYTSAFVAVYAAAIHFGMRIGDAWVFVPVCVAVAALLHLLLFLSRFWSVRIRAALDYRPVRSSCPQSARQRAALTCDTSLRALAGQIAAGCDVHHGAACSALRHACHLSAGSRWGTRRRRWGCTDTL